MTKTKDDIAIERKIRLLQKHALELSKLVPSDDAIADAVGLTREVEVSLAKTRQKWEAAARAEMEPIPIAQQKTPRPKSARGSSKVVAESKQYRLVPQYKTVRSFNSQALLAGLAGEDGSILQALQTAMTFDAVRLTWRWTELNTLLRDQEVALRIEYREINDFDGTDGPMVGERKVDAGMKRELIEQDDS